MQALQAPVEVKAKAKPKPARKAKYRQSATMQARWGLYGDCTAIGVGPYTRGGPVTETFCAFNLAACFRTPVTIWLDEVIGHVQEVVNLPEPGEYPVVNRVTSDVAPTDYEPYGPTENGVNPMPACSEGYCRCATRLTHDAMGFPTERGDEVLTKMKKLRFKVGVFQHEICLLEVKQMNDMGKANKKAREVR